MSNLSISDLFTPAQSGVNVSNPGGTVPAGSWLAKLLSIGTTVGLPTTQWLAGGITRSQLAMLATALSTGDTIVSTMAQGGFLDWAAAVTLDPSVVASTSWTPGWLDKLAASTFNCSRVAATYAPVSLTITNSSGGILGPYLAGSFHVSNLATGATYRNVPTMTLATGANTVAFVADVSGSGGTSSAGTITHLVTALVGVTCTNAAACVGSNAESNGALVARCRLKQGSLSPNGPDSAYEYMALSAQSILQAQQSAVTLTGGVITRAVAITDTDTGTVDLVIANAAGSEYGETSTPVITATNASPIVLTVGPGTYAGVLNVGDWIVVAGVEGNTAANGFHQIANVINSVGNTVITMEASSAGNGAYTAGGSAELGDLGLVDYVVRSNVVPLAVSERTTWASTASITVAVTVYVPAVHATDVIGVVQAAVVSYFANVPIGGFLTGVPTPNTIPVSGCQAACAIAAPYITDISVTFNGAATDVAIAATAIPIISGTVSVTVIPS